MSPSRLRVALITRRYPPLLGGAETMIRYLAQALADQGAAVTVLTSAWGAAAACPAREFSERGPGTLEIVRLGTSRIRYLGTGLYMNELRRWLARNPPDVAYVSMLKHDAYVAVRAGREKGFPVVLRPEGAGATGDLSWQSWARFGKRIGRECLKADRVVAISRSIRAELEAAGYSPGRIVDLPNGVPVPEQPWRKRAGWKDEPTAVSVGRLSAEKGHADLVAAWPAVLGRFPAARLVILGEGPERPHLEELCRRHRLSSCVFLPGTISDVTSALRAADLFVLPSHEEGMSLALLEAMALGMPLVATNIPGNAKLVDDQTQGMLARPGDPSSLARCIVEQWADPDRGLSLGRAARTRVEREFAISSVARRHLEFFQTLVENTGKAPA